MNFLKLIRWTNLLIIAATLYLLRYCIMQPLLESNGLNLQLRSLNFSLLALATVLLAAAGYIINDIYDIDADNINRPDKVIIGNFISIRFAENLYLLINAIAISIGIYISFMIGTRFVSLAFVLVAGLLYFYATSYKSLLVLGNLIVALFAAIVPLMVLLFELPLLKEKYKIFEISSSDLNYIFSWLGFYAIFAFLISFTREIVKDLQDIEGDAECGIKTLPVAFGLKVSKAIVLLFLGSTLFLIIYILICYLYDPISLTYIVPLVIAPIVYTGWIIYKASGKKDYERASRLCKLIMFTGIMYSIIVKYVLLNHP